MNNTTNPSEPNHEPQPGEAPAPDAGTGPGHCAFEPLRSAVNDGASRAQAAAEKAVPRIKAALIDATYWLGYGVSFASVFSYTVARELAPEPLKAGFRDGTRAGRTTAENLAFDSSKTAGNPPPGASAGQPSPV